MNQRKAGVVLSYISMGLNAIIGFVYIPMLLMFLTKEEYGLYQLVGSMIAYLTIMDFGLANTTVRYYSRFLANKDVKGQENLLATMLRLYIGISCLVAVCSVILLYVLLPFYTTTLSPAEIVTTKYIYWIMVFNLIIVIPGHVFSAIIQSHEKFIFLRCANILNIILRPILIFIVLYFKASIISLVVVQTVCNIVLFLVNIYYSVFKLGVKFHLYKWEGKFVKEILFFSFFIFLNAIMDQIYWKTGQLILGAIIGTVSVAIYSIAIQLTMIYISFSCNISGVFLPKLSMLAIKDDLTETNNIFIKIGRLQFYIVMLIFLGFLLFGKQFISLWVGESFLPAYYYTLLFMGALIIPLIQNTGILILQARNKHAFRAIIYLIIAIINVVVSIPLVKKYGAIACAISNSICLLVGTGLIINIYYKKLGIAIIEFWKQITKLLLPMAIPVISFMLVLNYYSVQNTVINLLVQIILFIVFYCLVVWKIDFNDYEKSLVLSVIRKFRK